jgi:NAD+ synthase (glutamine-hydrolysing)
MKGFFLPLSGGLDSASSAVITFSMCRLVVEATKAGNQQVIKDLRRIAGEPENSTWLPATPQGKFLKIYVIINALTKRNVL